MSKRLTLVITDDLADRPTYWQEFLVELVNSLDGNFHDGQWYIEATDG